MSFASAIADGTLAPVILRRGEAKNLSGDAQEPGDPSPQPRSGCCENESRAGRAAGPYRVSFVTGGPLGHGLLFRNFTVSVLRTGFLEPWGTQDDRGLAVIVVFVARKVDLAEARGVGEDVDLDDLPARDREAHDR